MRDATPASGDLAGVDVAVVPLTEEVVGGMRSRLWLLQGAVALLVLIACINVASLVLAKATATRGELAIRAALGAGRGTLVRLALSESALLGLGGGVLGLLLARSLAGVVLRIAPRDLPLADRIAVDSRVVLMTLAIALAAGILAGLVPALGIDLRALTRAMGGAARSVAGGTVRRRVRFALVATEVALTLVLLIGATVMLRSFARVWRSDPGFDRRDVLTFFAPPATSVDGQPIPGYHHELLDGLRNLPGVVSVGGTTHMPFSAWRNRLAVQVGDVLDRDQAPNVDARWITEGYLETMSIELRAGRPLVAADGDGGEALVLVNEAFVQRFFDAGNQGLDGAVGRILGVWDYTADEWVPRRIIGIVENVKTTRLFEEDRPLLYVPERQQPRPFMRYVLRADGDPMALVPAIRRLAAEIDGRQALTEIYPLETLVAQSITEERFYAQVLAAFGALAFVIAAAGIYGTVAYNARLRLREMGIRIAFGARPAAIRRLIVGQGLLPVATGIVAGCAGAVALVRGLAGLVHGISPVDAPSFAAGALVLAGVAALAALIPARRAAAVDPIEVLRPD
jgi:putative ABC transport system permease protein